MEFAFSRLIIELVITILCLRNYRFYIINYIYANRQALGLEKNSFYFFFKYLPSKSWICR
jgi:hypothetical protein